MVLMDSGGDAAEGQHLSTLGYTRDDVDRGHEAGNDLRMLAIIEEKMRAREIKFSNVVVVGL